MKRSLKTRLTLCFAVLQTLALLIVNFIDIKADEGHLVARLDESILRQMNRLVFQAKRGDVATISDRFSLYRSKISPEYEFQITRSDGTIIFESCDTAVYHFPTPSYWTSERRYNLSTQWGRFRVIELPIRFPGGGMVLLRVGSARGVIDEHIAYVTRVKMFAVIFVSSLTTAGTYFLVRRVLRPIRTISDMVKGMTLRDPAIHIPESELTDEFSTLTRILNEGYGRLQDASQRISHFTSEAAHELRSPIAAIRLTAESSLRVDSDVLELRRAIGQIYQESVHMSELVSQLLTLSRLESSERAALNDIVRIDYILVSLTERFKSLALEASLTFTVDEPIPWEVKGDRIHLRQLFSNVIDNAFKYTPSGGQVTMSCHLDRGFWHLRITDTGIGISKEHLPRIFDRFFRADCSHSKRTTGSGLGLPICKAISTMHGGELTASSTVGSGTTIVIALPGQMPIEDESEITMEALVTAITHSTRKTRQVDTQDVA